ncbi:MAG TPA: ATP-dependent Clp protease proteolytic subunit [Streptosporangiaceae bacterium]|nr:ATP-dependent Clp protease proteolytic subunit [Streptosporangiaceae bacterium]
MIRSADAFPPPPGDPSSGFPGQPEIPRPGAPRQPEIPWPGAPREPGTPQRPAAPPEPAVTPGQMWPDRSQWPGRVYERLFDRRIVLAHGDIDDEAATSLCAQLLTLDAELNAPIRLEVQGLNAELAAALTVMDVLDTLRVPVRAYAGGQVAGPALGVLAAATERHAYPNAVFLLSEPRLDFHGSATSLGSHEEQVRTMLDALYRRLADVTGREVDEIRADARRGRYLSVADAVGYGLIQELAQPR